jgi:hypothetical protein
MTLCGFHRLEHPCSGPENTPETISRKEWSGQLDTSDTGLVLVETHTAKVNTRTVPANKALLRTCDRKATSFTLNVGEYHDAFL